MELAQIDMYESFDISPERRKRPRANLNWRVRLLPSGELPPIDGVTQNISSDGLYCVSRLALTPGQHIEFMLSVPSHDARAAATTLVLRCRAIVVHVEFLEEGRACGAGVHLEDYSVVRPEREYD